MEWLAHADKMSLAPGVGITRFLCPVALVDAT